MNTDMDTDSLRRRVVAELLPPGQVCELRAPDATVRPNFTATLSGYFDDAAKLDAATVKITAAGLYITLNPVAVALLARRANRVKQLGKNDAATGDKDILARRWLLLDIDPVRPSGICATDDEKGAALALAGGVETHLKLNGWPDPLIIDSGNGCYLLYRIDLPADDGGLVKRCLVALATRFDTDAAKIDTSVHNPARLVRLPGTMNRKGDSTVDRPYRPVVVLACPDPVRAVPVELLHRLAEVEPDPPTRATPPTTGTPPQRLDVPKYLTHFGVEVLGCKPLPDGRTAYRVTCPFDPAHTCTDASVMQDADGKRAFKCFHQSCQGKGWQQFKAAVGDPLPDHYDPPRTAHPPTRKAGERPARVSASAGKAGGQAAARPVLRRMSAVVAEPIRWLWSGRFPRGRLSLLAGHPGASKSLYSLMMASVVSTGGHWPDGGRADAGDVLLIGAEDGLADTVRPRLDAAGADVDRIHAMTAVAVSDPESGEREVLFSLANVEQIRMALGQLTAPRLVIVDPVGSFLGGAVDAHRDNEVRAVLAPLAAVAEEFGVAVVLVAHTTKAHTVRADDAILGSRAFSGIVRAVYHIGTDPDDSTGKRILCLPGKSNLGPRMTGLAYHIESVPHPVGSQPRLAFEADPVEVSADDAFGVRERPAGNGRGPQPVKRDAACRWLVALLRHGPRAKMEIEAEAEAAGLGEKILRIAREHLEIVPYKAGFSGGWRWRLPDGFDHTLYPTHCEAVVETPAEVAPEGETGASSTVPGEKCQENPELASVSPSGASSKGRRRATSSRSRPKEAIPTLFDRCVSDAPGPESPPRPGRHGGPHARSNPLPD